LVAVGCLVLAACGKEEPGSVPVRAADASTSLSEVPATSTSRPMEDDPPVVPDSVLVDGPEITITGDVLQVEFFAMCGVGDAKGPCELTGSLTLDEPLNSTLTASGTSVLTFKTPVFAPGSINYALDVSVTRFPEVTQSLSGSISIGPDSYTELDLGTPNDAGQADTSVVYRADFNDGEFGLGLDLEASGGTADGPAGFGVDANGVVHLMDGLNHRVVLVAPDGTMSARDLPAQLDEQWIAGFATGPDGTEYVSTTNAVSVVRDGAVIGEFSNAQLGVLGVLLELRADERGLLVQRGQEWSLAISVDPTPALVAADGGSGFQDTGLGSIWSTYGADGLRLWAPGERHGFLLVSDPAVQAAYIAERSASGLWVLLVRSSSSEVPDNTQLVVVDPSTGQSSHAGVDVPTENMVQNGMYAHLVNGLVYLEVGDSQGVSVLRLDPTSIRPKDV
jgi:hypothetical protein